MFPSPNGLQLQSTGKSVRTPIRNQYTRRRRACAPLASEGDTSTLGPETANLLRGRKFVSLNQAEEDIKEFCMHCDGDEKARCLTTLSRLQNQHKRALDKVQDASTVSQAEAELERLDAMARELSAIGSVQLMVDAIHHLQGKQEADRLAGCSHPHTPSKTPEELAAQERLRAVFDRMDLDGDGTLNIGEFRMAMDALGDHLDGPMVAEICDALGVHGRICFDQFEDIVAAEAIRARTRQAAQLRTLLHDDSENKFREWLDSWQ